MIRIEKLTVKEFRGIRDLTLDFGGKPFAICGPNGTGKSGIVDALEFALTGNVSRLTGEGRGDVSLKTHAPHVDSRNAPEKARVIVTVKIPSLNKTATIERQVKTATSAKITPNDPDIIAILQQVEAHPEIVLSRRELIRYVLATPGKRADEVRALLHLDQVEQVRAGLQKIANGCDKQLTAFTVSATQARDNLLRALEITELSKDKLLSAANAQRAHLGLPALVDLIETTSLKDGMESTASARTKTIPKAQALTDVRTAVDSLTRLSNADQTARVAEATADIDALAGDPLVVASVTAESFYTNGLNLIGSDACPLCDTTWNLDELKKHIQTKIENLKEAARKRKAIENKLSPLIVALRDARSAIEPLVRHAALTTPPIDVRPLQDFNASCVTMASTLTKFLPLAETKEALGTVLGVPKALHDTIAELEKAISTLPEPTKQDAARDWLTVAQERLDVYRDAMRKQKSAKEQADRSRKIYDTYVKTSDEVLAGIYAHVEKDFAALYGFINRNDEEKFKAQLVPSMGKLGFDVDFYGRGYFPPGAYHSEGHQDSMGLCLYLALMRHLHGNDFTFAVLDDVLMSVDSGHRREVCALLRKEFPHTQFIMTTHDPIWLRHMKTEALIGGRSAVQFRHWDVDQGPALWEGRDVWLEIGEYLKQNNVRGAAALLRHYLEYESAELCHRLRAPVEFRGDAQYQLGELLPAAIQRMRKLYTAAKDAANSWNQKSDLEELTEREKEFAARANASKAEQWQVNVAVHFNSWDNLVPKDFTPVVDVYRELLAAFTCRECFEFLRVSPDRESVESLRCDCGKTNINLNKKPR